MKENMGKSEQPLKPSSQGKTEQPLKPSSQEKTEPKPSSQVKPEPKPTRSVDPDSLRFTQESISDSFTGDHCGVKLEDTIKDIKTGKLDPKSLGTLEVHKGYNDQLFCENNRRLFVLREAEVPEVDVKVKNNDYLSRRYGKETKDTLSNPEFVPKVRDSDP